MAWIVGDLNPSEKKILAGRGWLIQDAEAIFGKEFKGASRCYVDSDMFLVMDGPDWQDGGSMSQERADWRRAVAAGETDLDFRAWLGTRVAGP